MWEIDLADQITSFLLSIPLGFGLTLLFYTADSFRMAFRLSRLTVWFLDIFFFISAAIISFCFFILRSNGEIRGYILFGEFFGFIIFKLVFSNVYLKILSGALKLLGRVFSAIGSFLSATFGNLFEKLQKSFKNLKNIRKKG